MYVLHLTDLHLTPPNAELGTIWAGIDQVLPDRTFDAVILSGDLTQEAATGKNNYSEVADFIRKDILVRVVGQDIRRVIIVPGNHDVDWKAQLGDDIPLVDFESNSALKEELKAAKSSPETSQLRTKIGQFGITAVTRINWTEYHKNRFANFQHFLTSLYGPATGPEYRPFNLISEKDADHWSAHIFANEGVAFCGFNSCQRNDASYRGASVSRLAILQARSYLATHAPGLTWVAIWHHGLTSERGHPDHLTLSDLGQFVSNGFHLGIHGHTHVEELKDLFQDLRRQFPVIATGSFSAGPSERPGGVRNQLSTLNVNRAYARWTVYERNESNAEWKSSNSTTYLLRSPGVRKSRVDGNGECRHHERSVIVDGDGIATINIRLDGLTPDGLLTLASPSTGNHRISFRPRAITTRGVVESGLDVREETNADGARRYVVDLDPQDHVDILEWSYDVANHFSLDSHDMAMAGHASAGGLLCKSNEDAWIHHARFCTEELVLRLTLPSPVIRSARLVALAPHTASQRGHADDWRDDPVESARPVPQLDGPTPSRSVSVKVSYPRPGYRYALVYALEPVRVPIEDEIITLLNRVLEQCRDYPLAEQGLAQRLTAIVRASICTTLNVSPTMAFTWLAHLWSANERRLLPAFGDAPPRSWASEFAYGSGIAGHCFRMQGPAVYCRHPKSADSASMRTQLLHLDKIGDRKLREHNWIVQVPICLEKGRAIGTIGFSDQTSVMATELHAKLASLAESLPSEDYETSEQAILLDTLSSTISESFWRTLSQTGKLEELFFSKSVAESVFKEFWSEPPSISLSTAPPPEGIGPRIRAE